MPWELTYFPEQRPFAGSHRQEINASMMNVGNAIKQSDSCGFIDFEAIQASFFRQIYEIFNHYPEAFGNKGLKSDHWKGFCLFHGTIQSSIL